MTSRHSLTAKGTSLSISENNVTKASDSETGIGDLFLPTSYIFTALYYPLLMIARNLSFIFFPWIVAAAYPIVLLLLFFFKKNYVHGNRDYSWINIIDENVGLRFIDICIIVIVLVLLLLAIIGRISSLFLPLLLSLLVGVIVNSFFFKRTRVVEDPYKAWDGDWRRRRFAPLPPNDNLIDIHFSWVDILAVKGVKGDDKLDSFTIQLSQTDYEGSTPRVRLHNPYYIPPGLQYENDRDSFTNVVLDGADKALQNDGETDCKEDRALTQIVNSAFDVCKRYNLANFEMFDLILLFCQKNVEYKYDDECDSINRMRDYFRFASETLYDRAGDCDCKAVLAYKLFELLGVDPQLVIVKANHEDVYNHAAIILRNDADASVPLPPQYKEYAPNMGVYCEATANGDMHPGDIPNGVDVTSMKFINRKVEF